MTGAGASGVDAAARHAVGGRGTGRVVSHDDTDTQGFARALLTMNAGNMASRAEARIGGGTMRAAVEAFGAHGLFDGATPFGNSPAGADTPGDDRGATTSGMGERPAIVDPVSAREIGTAGGELAVSAVDAIPPSELKSGATEPVLHGTTDRRAMAARTASIEAEAGIPIRPTEGKRTGAATPFRRELTEEIGVAIDAVMNDERGGHSEFAAARADRSALTVSLDRDQHGITVTVAGAVLPHEEARVRQAVTRLVARHGLVLSALRLIRQSPVGYPNQGDR